MVDVIENGLVEDKLGQMYFLEYTDCMEVVWITSIIGSVKSSTINICWILVFGFSSVSAVLGWFATSVSSYNFFQREGSGWSGLLLSCSALKGYSCFESFWIFELMLKGRENSLSLVDSWFMISAKCSWCEFWGFP